ncbi:MAG: hypothetical protein KDJ90_00555 [Nitratireductor sp.]|nr:hypothetical protein [Nitratireductor sp.]
MTDGKRELSREEMSKLGIHENQPECGYYRDRSGKAIAIFEQDGEIVALAGGIASDPARAWSFGCKFPVTYEQYSAVAERGEPWPDEAPPVAAGDNLSDDPCEALKQELEGERELAEQFLKDGITTKEQADKAATWAKRLGTLSKKADDLRKVEKQPHIDAGATVDAKWNPIRDDAKDLSTRLKRHLDAWLREQDRLERERQARAREEAERAQREAEEAARAAAASDDAEAKARAEEAAEQAKQAERDAAERNAQAGRTGAKVSLRTFVSAEITDYDALLIALKDHSEVKELVQSLANRAAKSGVVLAGMKIVEERRAA